MSISNITPHEAAAALASVGRSPLGLWRKFPRPRRSSLLLDELENRWWNTYAGINEKMHSMPDDVCWAMRGGYLSRARDFLLGEQQQATVLELGCGSGWFGRMIAAPNFCIIGLDGSQSQVELAHRNAQLAGKADYCSYRFATSPRQVAGLASIDGVIAQGFLHHLYGDELEDLFSDLGDFLPTGTRLLIIDPVYHTLPATSDQPALAAARSMIKNLNEAMVTLKQQITSSGKYDRETERQSALFLEESNRYGFFASPKEVHFEADELRQIIGKHATILQEYITGIFDFQAAQLLALITDPDLRKEMTGILLPIAKKVDSYLLNQQLTGNFISNEQYLYTAFECEL